MPKNRAVYIAGTTLAAAVVGALLGTIWGYFAQEEGWWGAGMILGLILGIVFGVAVAERATT
jgi:F0F1-type ATP synthase assembly protein I